MNVDEYLKDVIESGFVYIVYSEVLNRIYVGESISMKRVNIYQSIIDEKDSLVRFKLYNFYSKTLNKDLLYDIVNYKNEFKILTIETKYHKHLEKSYIRYFVDNRYRLYNRKKYKTHKYIDIEIDENIINSLKNIKKLSYY